MLRAWRNKKLVKKFGSNGGGKRPLGGQRRRWEYDIKMDLREIWMGLWTGKRFL
jgi:hypothetical protein